MIEFERITQSPETLAAFLASLPCIEGPWDVEFQKRFCSGCARTDCDSGEPCPHAAERSNPGWWLNLETDGNGYAEKYAVIVTYNNGTATGAASSNQAKREFCREYGISPSDYWCGLSALTARRLKPEEVKAWEEQAEANRDTLIFIQGMLEIGAKSHAERGCVV